MLFDINPFVTETLLDLLELYTHHRTSTAIGSDFPVDTFLEVRIPLNLESEDKRIPRYTAWVETSSDRDANVNATPGFGAAGINGSANGSHSRSSSKNVSPKDVTSPSTNSSSGIGSGSTAATSVPGGAGLRQRAGERGREGTVRFILHPEREREERAVVELFRGT